MQNLNSIIEQLNRVELNPGSTFCDVCEILGTLRGEPLIAPILAIPESYIIFRGRSVKSFDEVQKVEDISYPPINKCEDFGRANMPRKPMFYGVVTENKMDMQIDSQIKLCINESCAFLNSPEPNVEYRVVIGIWQNSKPLYGIPVINPDNNGNRSGINKKIAQEFSSYMDHIDENGGGTDIYSVEEIINFQRFLHHKFTSPVRNSRGYWVSAKLTDDLILEKDKNIDGIFYESSKGRTDPKLSECLSLAIKPSVVDEKLVFCAFCDVVFVFNQGKRQFHVAHYQFRK